MIKTLDLDVEYLKSQRFMDYSLLLAIRKKPKVTKKLTKKMTSKTIQDEFEEEDEIFDEDQTGNIQSEDSEREKEQESLFTRQLTKYKKSFTQNSSNSSYASTNRSTIFYSTDAEWSFQISIIDYLQTFDSAKKQEVMAKKLFKNVNLENLSAVPPDKYGDRFKRRMKQVFEQDRRAQK